MKTDGLKDKIVTVIAFIIIAVLSMYVVLQIVAPDMTVRVFGFKPYIVITDSMEPELSVNDVVVVTRFDVEDLEVGDIITFHADVNYDGENDIVTHYIHSVNINDGEYSFRTRPYYADPADYSPDPWVLSENDILGVYSFDIPWIGTIGQFVRSPFGIAAIVVNVGVIIGIVIILRNAKEEEPEQTESTE